ncbi:kinase [Fusarium beomiforme]|uniref:Kinase n=1 Tax=Fusarium beomiforme TaxID=44412 RepID=A0A9P5DSS1_9HYPO|nr:kinase [Fusarium beomiforme]
MDPNMSPHFGVALTHTSTQSEPTLRSHQSLVGTLRRSHSVTEGMLEDLAYTETGDADRHHEPDELALRRSKREGYALKSAQKGQKSSDHIKSLIESRVKGLSDKLREPGRLSDAFGRDQSLRVRVFRATVPSVHPDCRGKRFLPRDEIQKVLTEEAVEKELAQCDKWQKSLILRLLRPHRSDFKKEARMICGTATTQDEQKYDRKTYRKIFAILVLLKRPSLIFPFLEQRVCDDDLPLKLGDVVNTAVITIRTRNGKEVTLRGFRRKKSFYDKFIEKQWVVLSTFFEPLSERNDNSQTLEREEIPPFTSWTLVSDRGGFGEVFKVEIHASHHSFRVSPINLPFRALNMYQTNVFSFGYYQSSGIVPQVFAIKRLGSRSPPPQIWIDPENEATVLRKLKDRHNHIISLLATYRHYDCYHFIFPWADADLKGYWYKINPNPSEKHRDENLKWLAHQCQGLADGLSYIHRYHTASFSLFRRFASGFATSPANPRPMGSDQNEVRELFGRHGDIKPENILWFPDQNSAHGILGGILKITDFGLAEFSTKAEVSQDRRGFIANSPTYRAPETDLSSSKGLVSPSYDVWALGCLYLEFLAWWLGGCNYVQDFAKQRLREDKVFWKGRTHGFKTDSFFSIILGENAGEDRAQVREEVVKVSILRLFLTQAWQI